MKKNVWHSVPNYPELRFGQYVVPNFVSNSIAIRVAVKEFVVVSPGKPLLDSWFDAWPELNECDDIKIHIVMPNGFHYMGVDAWQKRFRHYQLYASKKAIKRLVEQGVVASESEIFALETTLPNLPDGYGIEIPPGHRAGDAWLTKKDEQGTLWITCDSFLNYDRLSNQPIARFSQKLLDAAPGLKMSQVVKWYIIDQRPAFKEWVLHKLLLDQPTTLIPSHGEIDQSQDLAKKLEKLVSSRL